MATPRRELHRDKIILDPTLAADDHEYKFVPMMKETTAGDQEIIIDEKQGDLWEYLNQPAVGKLQAINGIKYIRKLHPGRPESLSSETLDLARQ